MFMLQKPWDTVAKTLAGLGALSIGALEFLKFDLVGVIPEGIIAKVVLGAIGLSGLYILLLVYNKRI